MKEVLSRRRTTRIVFFSASSLHPSRRESGSSFTRLFPRDIRLASPPTPHPFPRIASALVSVSSSSTNWIGIAAGVVSVRGSFFGLRALFLPFTVSTRPRRRKKKSKSPLSLLSPSNPTPTALSISDQMPPIGPLLPLGGAGGGRGRRERGDSGARKQER